MNLKHFNTNLLAARINSGLTQAQLARTANLRQSHISLMEHGKRLPTLPQLLKLATAMKVSLQWFLTGTNMSGNELADISFQLQTIGIADLAISNERVPGAFRPEEEVIVLAVSGNAPSARIIEAMPAVLAWNLKNRYTLKTYADLYDPRIKFRLGWLADIAVTIHQNQGFPGGCPYVSNLEEMVHEIERERDSVQYEDDLGFPRSDEPCPPVSLRWKMHYPAQLSVFRERAERLHDLRRDKMKRVLGVS